MSKVAKQNDLLILFKQVLPVQVGVGTDIRTLCEGIILRSHALAKEFSTLPADVLAAKWIQPKAQGEVGPVMAQLSATSSAEDFKSLFLSVCRAVDSLLKDDAMVVDVRPPVKIFGDIHGQLQDLLRLFSSHGFPITGSGGDIDIVTYVFNGDFVDRGPHQLEVLLLLFALKIVNPSRVVLLRGNHETYGISSVYGYSAECRRISCSFGKFCPLHRASLDLFEWLPVAAVVSGAVLVLHGGIGDGLWSLEQLRSTRRPVTDDILDDERSNQILANVLWSDPIDGDETIPRSRTTQVCSNCVHMCWCVPVCVYTSAHQCNFVMSVDIHFYFQPSERGGNFLKFGIDVSRDFCARNSLKMVVRSHQYWIEFPGYKVHHEGRVITVSGIHPPSFDFSQFQFILCPRCFQLQTIADRRAMVPQSF